MSDPAVYVDACERIMAELVASISPGEVEVLRAECGAMGRKKWLEWIYSEELRVDLRTFVELTPSQRRSEQRWADPEVWRHLVLAAYQHVAYGWAVLEAHCEAPLALKGSYRKVAYSAGDFYVRLLHEKKSTPEWPFDGRNPFN